VNECKPLASGLDPQQATFGCVEKNAYLNGRGLHSFTFRLSVSASSGTGGAFRSCLEDD